MKYWIFLVFLIFFNGCTKTFNESKEYKNKKSSYHFHWKDIEKKYKYDSNWKDKKIKNTTGSGNV
jgi:hypothetical protein